MKSLQETKKVLVATVATPTYDQYAAVHTIATSLKNAGKEVHLGISSKIPDKFTKALPLGDIKVLDKLPPKKFLLEFKNQKSKVKAIQWNQENDVLKFFLTMESGNFMDVPPQIKTLGSDYESIVMVGVNNFSEMGAVYTESKDIYKDANIILVGGQAKEADMKITTEFDDKHLSICEDTFYFMQKNSLKIEQKEASVLLSGVFFATKNFKKNLNDAKTFITSAELAKRGATNEEAQRLVDAIKSDSGSGQKPQGQKQPQQNQPKKPSQPSQGQGSKPTTPQGGSNGNNQNGGYKPMQNIGNYNYPGSAPQKVDF